MQSLLNPVEDLEDIKGALAQIWQLQRSILSSQR